MLLQHWIHRRWLLMHQYVCLFPILPEVGNLTSLYTHSDNNECLSDNGGCDHNCTDSDGSYTCSCNNGYQLNNDGHTCEGLQIISICNNCNYNSKLRLLLNLIHVDYNNPLVHLFCVQDLKIVLPKYLPHPICIAANQTTTSSV